MKKAPLSLLALGTVGLLAVGLQSYTANAQSEGFSAAQKDEMGKIIREYILDNPEIIFEAADKHRANQEDEQNAAFNDKHAEYSDYLYNSKDVPSVGNKNADITIVEFFDFNCGYCHKAASDVQNIIEKDKNVRFVFVDMPILSSTSRDAAKWALAADKQGKYFDFHMKLMTMSGAKTPDRLAKVANDMGLDVEQMKKDVAEPAMDAILDKNLAMAQDMGIRGTPGFIIGDFLARGYMGLDAMQKVIEQQREDNKS